MSEEKGLKQVSDPDAINKIVDQTISECADQVKDFISGNERIFGFLVGRFSGHHLKKELERLI